MVKTAENIRLPAHSFWETVHPFWGMIKIGRNWKKHFFDWGAQFHVDAFGNLFWVWESGTTGRLVELPEEFHATWLREMDTGNAYKVYELVARIAKKIATEAIQREASCVKTAGVSISVVGHESHDLVWIMYAISSKVYNSLRTVLDEYDVDGGSDYNAFLGQINFYLKQGASEEQVQDAKVKIEAAAKSFHNDFEVRVWSDVWEKWNTPVIRVEVISNKSDGGVSLEPISITYSTWSRILKAMDLPSDDNTVTGGTLDINTFLKHATMANVVGREARILQQIVTMAKAAQNSGYKELSWG